jgi:DNA-binding CsgD family transcriptional regulator
MGSIALRDGRPGIDQMPDGIGSTAHQDVPSDDAVAALLGRLIGCDAVTLIVVELAGPPGYQREWVGDRIGEETRLTAVGWLDHPLRGYLAVRGHSRVPFRVAALSQGQQPIDMLVLPIQSAGQRVVCWTLTRRRGRFAPQDLRSAELVLPGLRTTAHPAIKALTERELDVLQLIALGLTSTSIARRCGISVRTVHKHLEHIYDKLGCRDRVSAALMLRDADSVHG